MSWVPPDLATLCSSHSTVSTCQPSTFIFLAFIARLFGYSKDSHLHEFHDFDSPWNAFNGRLDYTLTYKLSKSNVQTQEDGTDGYQVEDFLWLHNAPVKLESTDYSSRFECDLCSSSDLDDGSEESTANFKTTGSTVNFAEVYDFNPGISWQPITALSKDYGDFLIPQGKGISMIAKVFMYFGRSFCILLAILVILMSKYLSDHARVSFEIIYFSKGRCISITVK